MQVLFLILLIPAAIWAAVTDLRSRRIPNWLTFGLALAALALRLATGGEWSLLAGAEGWIIGTALMFIPFAFRLMGAGDVKLLAAFGAIGGPVFVCQTALVGALAGGAIAIFYVAREHKLGALLWHTLIQVKHPEAGVTLGVRGWVTRHQRIPYGPALAAGAIAVSAFTSVAR